MILLLVTLNKISINNLNHLWDLKNVKIINDSILFELKYTLRCIVT